jgi:hypothetical protein
VNCYKTDIFKQSIFSFKLNLDLYVLNNYCLEYEKNNKGRVISNLGGFQSSDLDINILVINKLISLILNNVSYVSKKYFKLEKSLYISNIWFNINRYKDNNNKHIHPNSLFSGVFYSKIGLLENSLDAFEKSIIFMKNSNKMHYYAPFPGQISEMDFKLFYQSDKMLFGNQLKNITIYH